MIVKAADWTWWPDSLQEIPICALEWHIMHFNTSILRDSFMSQPQKGSDYTKDDQHTLERTGRASAIRGATKRRAGTSAPAHAATSPQVVIRRVA